MTKNKESNGILWNLNTVISRLFLGFICFSTLAKFIIEFTTFTWFEWVYMTLAIWGASVVIWDNYVKVRWEKKMDSYAETWEKWYNRGAKQ